MKLFILINAILEIVAGLAMFLIPNKLPGMEETDASSGTFASMYGAAALAVGFFAIQAWNDFGNSGLVRAFLLTFIVFHAGVMTAAFRGHRSGLKQMMPVAILHGVFAILSLYFFTQLGR